MLGRYLIILLLFCVTFLGCNDEDVEVDGFTQLIKEGLSKVVPARVYFGDTLHLISKNFGNIKRPPYVFLDKYFVEIISWNDTSVSTIIPASLNKKTNIISIKFDTTDLFEVGFFEFHEPILQSVNSELVTFGDTITIHGQHLNNVKEWINQYGSETILKIGGILVPILSISNTSIKTIFPIEEVRTNIFDLNLKSQIFPDVKNNLKLYLRTPEITSVSDSIISGTEVIIYGNYFHPYYGATNVYFNDVKIESHYIIDASEATIKVSVPFGPFPDRDVKITVELLGLLSGPSASYPLLNDWRMLRNDLPFYATLWWGKFDIGEKGFVPGWETTSEKLFLWEFDQYTLEFSPVNFPVNFDFHGYESGALIDDDNQGFLYTANRANEFYSFDPETKAWKKLAPFPGRRRDYATMFVIGDFIYLGMGRDSYDFHVNLEDFFKYEISRNVWTQIDDFSDLRFGTSNVLYSSSVVLNGIAYFGGGDLDQLYKYDPTINYWSLMYPTFEGSGSSFSSGNKVIYFSFPSSIKVDPEMSPLMEIRNTGAYTENPYILKFSNALYLVGGSDYSQLRGLYTLDNEKLYD